LGPSVMSFVWWAGCDRWGGGEMGWAGGGEGGATVCASTPCPAGPQEASVGKGERDSNIPRTGHRKTASSGDKNDALKVNAV